MLLRDRSRCSEIGVAVVRVCLLSFSKNPSLNLAVIACDVSNPKPTACSRLMSISSVTQYVGGRSANGRSRGQVVAISAISVFGCNRWSE